MKKMNSMEILEKIVECIDLKKLFFCFVCIKWLKSLEEHGKKCCRSNNLYWQKMAK